MPVWRSTRSQERRSWAGIGSSAATVIDLTDTGSSVANAIDLTSDDEWEDEPNPAELGPPSYMMPLHGTPSLPALADAVVSNSRVQMVGPGFAQPHLAPPPIPLDLRSSTVNTCRQTIASIFTTRKSKHKAKSREPELQVLESHHKLSFWKHKYYEELNIHAEYLLAARAAELFDKSTVQTLVPDRYMRTTTAKKQNRRRPGFPGIAEILSAGKAVRQAYREHTAAIQDIKRLVLWTDGSAAKKNRGLAISWRRSTESGWGHWEAVGYKAMGASLNSNAMELLAVIKAVDKACELARQTPRQLTAVAIYSDSQEVIRFARNPAGRPLAEQIVRRARVLRQLGAAVALHWCPGHSKVPGNELADKVAGLASSHDYGNLEEHIDLSDVEDEGGEEDWEW